MKSDDEYDEQFREVFQEAVRCRMRSHYPAAVNFSGGLDSSTIAAMGKWLEREGRSPAPSFEFHTLRLPKPAFDEDGEVRALASKWNAESFIVDPVPRESVQESTRRFFDFPRAAQRGAA